MQKILAVEIDDKQTLQRKNISKGELENCITTLQELVSNSDLLIQLSEEQRIDLMKAAGALSRPDRKEIKKRNKALSKHKKLAIREQNRAARATTGIRSARTVDVFEAPTQFMLTEAKLEMADKELLSPRNCYVCKAEYTKLHPFYDCMCESCGDLNYLKRFQTADLTGQVALMTGSRLKIGYHVRNNFV